MKISDNFHKQYEKNRMWENTKWLGVPTWKLPFDAFVIQELIYKVKPDYIIETGTGLGGSSVFYASILELMYHGQVVTIDIDHTKHQLSLCYNAGVVARINRITGNSIDPDIVKEVSIFANNKRCLVILDSWHSYDHVLEEMKLYSQFVAVDSYMIVEDTHVSGHPVKWEYGKGPFEAVKKFLKTNNDFVADKECEKFMMTFNPNGYLKRIKKGA
jgi:cephalosporin hydroxylase